mmetsp:Transcript_14995/g.21802  ORF Transcript_14995/g.21802 Transcript_14995/m.21802 type:complete len:109 (-) Transcript_14995:3-329(-)
MLGDPLARVREEIRNNPVVVYGKSDCTQTSQVKAELDKLGVEYSFVDLQGMNSRKQTLQALHAITHQESMPYVFVGGEYAGTFDQFKQGVQTGKVQSLLKKHQVMYID